MRGFSSPKQAQRFLSVHAVVYNLFNLQRHLVSAAFYRFRRLHAFESWNDAVAARGSRTTSDHPMPLTCQYLGDGIVRARYRNSLTHAEPLEPGKPTEFTIALYPTSLVLQRGHRIRVDISSSNFPRFDANPNTYEPLNANTRWRVAANAIYHDAEHPSHLVLPVIPGEP